MTVPVLGGFPGCCSPAATGEPQRETQEQGGERQRDPCVTVCLQVNQHRCLRGSSREKRDGLLTWLFRRLARAQQKHVGRTLRVSGCSHKTSERVQTEMPRRKFEAKFKLPGGSQGEGCCEFRLRWFITARSVLPALRAAGPPRSPTRGSFSPPCFQVGFLPLAWVIFLLQS